MKSTAAIFLFLIIAAGVAWIFTDFDHPPQKNSSAVSQASAQTANIRTPSPPSGSAPISSSSVMAAQRISAVSNSDAIAIPLNDVSVRSQPELFEQVVNFYRTKLAKDPNNSAAQTTLNQLRERSLSELEMLIARGGDAAADQSLEVLARAFPELADNPRYKYLLARMDYLHRQSAPGETPESAASLAATNTQSANSSAKNSSTNNLPISNLPTSKSSANNSPTNNSSTNNSRINNSSKADASTSSENAARAVTASTSSLSTSPAKEVSKPRDTSAAVAKKSAENALSSKPDIRVVSITPGALVDNRFVPREDGNVLMVEISYRNFDKILDDQSEVSLVARLGVPGESMALAEAPVEILGDRGTKSFAMETLTHGDIGGKYQLNFILNGEFLTSRTQSLSMPRD